MAQIIITKNTEPDTPSANDASIYFDSTTKKITSKDDEGTVVTYGSGGAGNTVEDNLTSTSTTNALSANQGRVLKGLTDINAAHSGSPHANPLAEQNVQSDWAQANTGDDSYIQNKPVIPSVDNVLTSTSTTNALSALQGKNLQDNKVDKDGAKVLSDNNFTDALKTAYDDAVSKEHVHANATVVDALPSALGAANKVLKMNAGATAIEWLDDAAGAGVTIDASIIDGSTNPVQNDAIHDALILKAEAAKPILIYSATSTYNVGDQVIYDDHIYRCINPIATPEAWTVGKWTNISGQVTVVDNLSSSSSTDALSANQGNALDNSKANKLIPIRDYSAVITYNLNEIVVYNDRLWKCSTAITSGEAWNETKWTEISAAAAAVDPDKIKNISEFAQVICSNNDQIDVKLNNTFAGAFIYSGGRYSLAVRDHAGDLAALLYGATATQPSELQLNEAKNNGVASIIIKPPAALTAGYNLTLPDGDGEDKQFLMTDGSGNTSWEGVVNDSISNGNLLTAPSENAVFDALVSKADDSAVLKKDGSVPMDSGSNINFTGVTDGTKINIGGTASIGLASGNIAIKGPQVRVEESVGGALVATFDEDGLTMNTEKITGLVNGSASSDAVAYNQLTGKDDIKTQAAGGASSIQMKFWKGTQVQYDAIAIPDGDTMYFII